MKKIVPLCIALCLALLTAHGQAPVLEPGYATYILTPELRWVTMGTDVSGAEPITITWTKDGNVVPGENYSFYNIEEVRYSQAGTYVMTATNAYGSVSTEPIVLELKPNAAPVAELRRPMPGSTFTPGTEFSFSGYGSDDESGRSVVHTWRMDYHDGGTVTPGPPVADIGNTGDGETSGYFIIDHELVPAPGAFYRLYFTVADYLGLTDTDSVDIAWSGMLNSNLPEIERQPEDATVPEGSAYTFSVSANWATTFQWTFNGTPIPGATAQSYHIESVSEENTGTYRVLVSNSAGTTESDEAVLRLETLVPLIKDQPMNLTRAKGLHATFTVSAVGATSYQWKFNDVNISGATGTSLTINNVDFDDAGTYSVVVSNAYGSVESNDATLTVVENSPPSAFIVNPQPGGAYAAASAVQLEGFGTDPDQDYVQVTWLVELLRNGQLSPGPAVINDMQGAHSFAHFMVPAESELQPGDIFRVHLMATDLQGRIGTTYVDVTRATTSAVAIKTNPANLSAMMDGQTVMTRYSVTSAIGTEHTIAPVTPQTVNGVTYAFSNWAHGGAPTQTVTAANGNTSYTINYSSPLTGRWRTTDVGRVGAYGNAAFNNGTFTLSGSGNDIWGSADAFRFVYQSITGDVDIRARVTGLTYTHPWAKAGVMIRNSTDRSAKHAMTVVMAGNGSSFQRRTEAGGLSTAEHGSGGTPYWVRMVRNGNTFTSYVSPDGQSWSMVGTPMTIAMNSRVYVGLVLTSHSSSTLATATITDVSVTTPAVAASAARAAVPENQYEVFDVYPNPVSGNTLNVKFHDQASGRKLQVISLLGQVLYEQALLDDDASNNISIDIGSLPPGVYSIRASDKLKTQTRSFIRH